MSKQTIVQKGAPGDALFVFCHFDPGAVARRMRGTTAGAVVVERWGEGTRVYRPLVESYGGYSAWIDGIAAACGQDAFSNVALITHSAGSQVAKEVCRGGALPDAIVMLDGLYGDKPKGSRMGDGQVVLDDGLAAIARYAAAAARCERTMAILHSRIATPYASSRECAGAVRRHVEEDLGAPLADDPSAEADELGSFASAVSAGNLHIVEFPGADGAEHAREGQLYVACSRLWLPWAAADVAQASVRSSAR